MDNIAETPKTHISEEPSPAQSPGRAGEITPTGSFKVSMSYSGSCLPRCRCICHRRQMMRSSQVLEGIIGALFIGYVGVSILSPRCDRIDCKRPTTSGISINYFFPSWFVLRVLFFTIAFASHDDPEPGLGLPRVRPDDALIFEYSVKGSTQGVRFLLETGRASPYDVNPRGRAPLTVSPNLCFRAGFCWKLRHTQYSISHRIISYWERPTDCLVLKLSKF
jgi:hypothetical protein